MKPSTTPRHVYKLQEGLANIASAFQDVRDILVEIQSLAELIAGEALVFTATQSSDQAEALSEIHDLARRAEKQAALLIAQVPAS